MLAVRLNINVQLGRASLNPPDLCLKLGGTSTFHAATSVNVNVTATHLRVAADVDEDLWMHCLFWKL